MADEISSPLLSLVRELGLIDDLQYEEVAAELKRSGAPAFQLLQDFGIMQLDDILQVMANYLGTGWFPCAACSSPPNCCRRFRPTSRACINACRLASRMERCRSRWPIRSTRRARTKSHLRSRRRCRWSWPTPPKSKSRLNNITARRTEDVSEILKELGADADIAREVSEAGATDDERLMANLANEAPIVKFVNLVLSQAIQDRASDIHFEPFETEFRIRYRVDGALYEMSPPPKHLALPVISRLKVMANLNISERRLPQDGRINFPIGGRMIDLRVSTLPTQFGESVVLRVLDRSAVNLDIESLGFPKYVHDYVTEAIQRPNGIMIVTGPTGSGKTTTLYSCLRRINTMDAKLLTAEDPVEYDIEGIMQVAIYEAVGMTFGKALRSFLRQDPDIIMVG